MSEQDNTPPENDTAANGKATGDKARGSEAADGSRPTGGLPAGGKQASTTVAGAGTAPVRAAQVVRFPQSRVPPPRTTDGCRDLGPSPLARIIGIPREQQTGHYCSSCKGIWYGYPLEVECPICGNRKG